jgi:hypothetical protein
VASSSNAPIPSESTTIISQGYPSEVVPLMGLPHIQIPLVQALTVGPTPKPSDLSNNTLFNKYDLPNDLNMN